MAFVNVTDFQKELEVGYYDASISKAVIASEKTHAEKGSTISITTQEEVAMGTVNPTTGAYGSQSLNQTEEFITINREPSIAVKVIDSHSDVAIHNRKARMVKSSTEELLRAYDGDILGQTTSAYNSIDGETLGGSSGSLITPTPANILDILNQAIGRVPQKVRAMGGGFIAFPPAAITALRGYLQSRNTPLGDQVTEEGLSISNGFVTNVNNIDIYESTRLPISYTVTFSSNPSANDTLTITIPNKLGYGVNGVLTYTYVTSLTGVPGQVLLGGDTATTIVNTINAIKNPTTTTSTFVGFSDDLDTNTGKVAYDVLYSTYNCTNTSTTINFIYTGNFLVTLSESSSAITLSAKRINSILAPKNCVDVRVAKSMFTGFQEITLQDAFAKERRNRGLYGLKMRNEMREMACKINLSA